MFVGSEAKLLHGLTKWKNVGVISAVTKCYSFSLAKKVYEDFKNNNVDEQ